jgi:YidC/Oxa1 family membrane protein insertase
MWEAVLDAVFWCIQFFYNLCGDWGLSIIIITVIFRLLVTPLTTRQTKSSFQMQKVQPLLQEIQKKYAGDKVRIQEETQKIYAEAKFNPLASCLPMLLQMPIFITLFQVLNSMAERTGGSDYSFFFLVPSLIKTPNLAFAEGMTTFIPYVILMLIFAGGTFVPMILQQRGSDNPQRKQTLIMSGVMSVFMLYIGWNAPAGVLLFWGTSSLIAIVQQQIMYRSLRKKDREAEEAIEVKPIEVDVVRKAKTPRPTKKSK